jgi:hypothetical protein
MTQIWPRSDTFTENNPSPATATTAHFFSGYIRSVPSTTTYSYTSGSVTHTLSFLAGTLLNGYSYYTQGTPSSSEGTLRFFSGNFAAANPGTTASPTFQVTSRYHCFSALWRPYFGQNCKATAVFSMGYISGDWNPQAFKNCGVSVRVTGGTPQESGALDTNLHRIQNQTGYHFALVAGRTGAGATSTARFLLIKNVAGVMTTLAQVTFAQIFPSLGNLEDNPFARSRIIQMSLEAVDSGGNVSLTARAFSGGSAIVYGEIVGETTVLTYTDSSSPLTGSGRCGFLLSGYDEQGDNPPLGYSASRSSHLIKAFEIYDNSTAEVSFRDEFVRPQELGTSTTTASIGDWRDGNSVLGRNIMQLWGYDIYSGGGTTGGTSANTFKDLVVSTGNNRVATDASSAVNSTYYLTPSFSAYYSDRECTFVIPSLGNDLLALIARGTSFSGTVTREIAGGYVVGIRNFAGGVNLTAQVLLNGTIIATATITLASVSLSVPGSNTLRVKIDNVGQEIESGNVEIQLWINSVAVTFTSSVSGIVIDGTKVVDTRTTRNTGGIFEGIYWSDWAFLGIDTWNDLTVTTPPDNDDQTLTEEDMATIPLNSECIGKTGTLTVPYDWGVQEQSKVEAIVAPFEAGYRVRSVRHTRQRRRWTIRANAITDSERTTLLNFWTAHKGAEIPFDWVEPETGTTVAVRFFDDSLGVTLANPAVRQFEFVLEEVFC